MVIVMRFTEETKVIANEIIKLSEMLSGKMETWNDIAQRKQDAVTYRFSAGFTTKESESDGVQLVADVQVEPEHTKALLRTSAIEIIKDESDVLRFNNIELIYEIEYTQGEKITAQNNAMSREELTALLNNPATQLNEVVISDLTGRDPIADQPLGKRYEFTKDEIAALSEADGEDILKVLRTVLDRLVKSAERELTS